MPRIFAGLLWLVVALGGLGCDAIRDPTPQPSNCWVGVHGEYRLLATDGSDPGAAAVDEAARIIQARVSGLIGFDRLGQRYFEVRTRPDGLIEIDVPSTVDANAVRELVEPTGNIEVVPVPEGESVEEGDAIPSGAVALFGRDGLAAVSPGSTVNGERALDMTLTPAAGEILARHTAGHVGQQLAIVMDGSVLTALVVQAQLGAQFQISGVDAKVVNRLVTILRLPRLPGRLEEVAFGPVGPAPGCMTAN